MPARECQSDGTEMRDMGDAVPQRRNRSQRVGLIDNVWRSALLVPHQLTAFRSFGSERAPRP
jgi:hypothetical protein